MEITSSEKPDYIFRVQLLGNSGAGKSSIISRLIYSSFN